MLDAFIIDKIRKDQQAPHGDRVPLRIGIPSPGLEEQAPEADQEVPPERGVVDIDVDLDAIHVIG